MTSSLLRWTAAGTLLSALAAQAQAVDLTVNVTHARSDRGRIAAALYDSEGRWLKQEARSVQVAAGNPAQVVFRDLPAGRYAVSVFHDENGNDKLDTNFVGMPVERYGFSRDARGLFGPPDFADAVFELKQDTTLTIEVR